MNSISFTKCKLFYDTLLKRAVTTPSGNLVFVGYINDIYVECKMSRTYYSPIMRGLVELGCIAVERRGTRDFKSEIAVLRPPTVEEWLELRRKPLTSRQKADMLVPDVERLKRQLGEVDLEKTLGYLEARIVDVERQIRELNAKAEKDNE